jgi:trehalose 6-phosphate synthase/phosphatase
MSKIVFISNRLPVTVKSSEGPLEYQKSIGGLATGLKSFHEQSGSLWAGWPGLSGEQLGPGEKESILQTLRDNYQCLPVFLTKDEIDEYYFGFSNKTIWPLFHYFTNKVEYDAETWEAYCAVNRKFFEAVDPCLEPDDTVWVHDYQLMLLPQMIREKYPQARIGFFLHIPFPSYEIFRLLIWREEILRGILGADLVGFHTYDYVRHFLSSARRLLRLDNNLNRLIYEDRYIQADAFPMGIDYERFSREYSGGDFMKEARKLKSSAKGEQVILSIDRLDYTKGIPERLRAFGLLLEKYPEYCGKVRLILIVAPSRTEVYSYEKLLREIKELVSEVNGEYGTVGWMPVWFFFQSFTQENLIAFYRHSDVLLVTPLRDGMNLVCKEYIAARTDCRGMIVVSETTGAASELGEMVVVNPNDSNAIADGLKAALDMPDDEKTAINRVIHRRLKRYNVEFWANEFISALDRSGEDSVCTFAKNSLDMNSDTLEAAYRATEKRIIFLDYDGTLVGFKPIPEQAKPDWALRGLLSMLAADPKNTVVIVSGRDRHTLDKWLEGIDLHMLASHGLWVRYPGEDWAMTVSLDNAWKSSINHILELYADRMPGSLIEEKEYSLAFHYRQCEPDMAAGKLSEVKEALLSMTQSLNIGIQEGNKVLEIKDTRINKGQGASHFLRSEKYDFILGAGDDLTDEDLFGVLPEDAFSIKVGAGQTCARYYLRSWKSMRLLMQKMIDISRADKNDAGRKLHA